MTVFTTVTASEATVLPGVTTDPTPFGPFTSSIRSTAASGASAYQRTALDSQARWYERRGIFMGGDATSDLDLLTNYTGSTVMSSIVRVNGADFLRVASRLNTTPWPYTSTVVVPNGWSTLECFGDSVANTMRVLLYPAGQTTPLIDTGTITVDQGSAVLTSTRRGRTNTSTYTARQAWTTADFRTGNDAYQTTQGPLDVVPNQPPSGSSNASAGLIGRVLLTGTAADSDGTVATVKWDVTSWPATATDPTIQNDTSLTQALFYYTVGGTYSGTLTITDNDGATTVQNWSVLAPSPTSGKSLRKVYNGSAFV